MDASNNEAKARPHQADRLVNWQTGVLLGACVAGGLVLTTMVIGGAPEPAASAAATAMSVPAEATAPVDTQLPTGGAEPVVEDMPAVADVSTTEAAVQPAIASPTPPSASPLAPGATVKPVAAPSNAVPAQPAPTQIAAPAAAAPSSLPRRAQDDAVVIVAPAPTAAPASAPVMTAAPTSAPTPAPAPATTAAPTTVAAPPPPTTVASAASTPTYSVRSAGSVTLRFDGTSISVSSVAAQPNWVYQIDVNGPRSVEVKFFNVSTQAEAEFHAQVESGRIKLG